VTHSSSWWRGLTCNKAYYWKFTLIMLAKPFSCLLFGLATDFSNHDDTFGFWVVNKSLKYIDEVSSVERITADSNDSRLTKVKLSSLIDSFISQST